MLLLLSFYRFLPLKKVKPLPQAVEAMHFGAVTAVIAWVKR